MKKKVLTAVIAVFLSAIAGTCFFLRLNVKEYSLSDYAMGTVISATVYGKDGENTVKEIFSAVKNDEKFISRTVKGSDIYKINSLYLNECGDITVDTVSKALKICEESNGALDISVGKLSLLWNIDGENPVVPDKDGISNALKLCDYKKIKVDGNIISVPDGMNIDLGAVGKGKGADSAVDVLKKHGISGAVVSVGGTVAVYGKNPKGAFWTVGIRTPERETADYFATVKLHTDSFVSTSGSYEKYFEQNGEIYHHILDVKTGYPAKSGLKSVTVIADSGVYADALSTACFVLGYEKSLDLLEKYGAEAVFVFDDNSVRATENILKDLSIVDSRFTVQTD